MRTHSPHCYKRYLKQSSPLENCSSGNGKRPCRWRKIFSLTHTDKLHSSMLEMSSGMEECKITAWGKDNMPRTHAGILHSSMPEKSEEGLIFYFLYRRSPSGYGLGVEDRVRNLKIVSSILHCITASFFRRVNLRKIL